MLIILIVIQLFLLFFIDYKTELEKDKASNQNYKKGIQILLLIVSVAIAIYEYVDQYKLDLRSQETLKTVVETDSLIKNAVDNIYLNLERVNLLVERSNNMAITTDSLLDNQNDLFNKLTMLNFKLKNQIEHDIKKFKSEKPVLKIIESDDIVFERTNENRYRLKVRIRNVGQRSAELFSTEGTVRFFLNDTIIKTLQFSKLSQSNPLEPFTASNPSFLALRSNSFPEDINSIIQKVDLIIFKVVIKYLDNETLEQKTFYKSMYPKKLEMFTISNQNDIELFELTN
jgi:hypothetical protein